MLKRLCLAFAGLFVLATSAMASGTIPLSMTQQFDTLGNLLNGGKLYFFQAGTTTPQNAYSDSGLTLPLPNPITLDSSGRVPALFLADGTIKIRLTNSAGVTQLSADGIMVIGASSGTGSGSVVDATTVLAVGDLKVRYGTGALSGFVRANGRTIGSATSGASERANSDCQELFEYLWAEDANLSVSTGRGATAAADWAANKTIALPDWRGRALAALDDMGNTSASVISGAAFASGNGTTLGSKLGSVAQTIAQNTLPNVTLSYSNGISVSSSVTSVQFGGGSANLSSGAIPIVIGTPGILTSSGTSSGNTSSINGNVTQQLFPTVQPTMLATIYLKL